MACSVARYQTSYGLIYQAEGLLVTSLNYGNLALNIRVSEIDLAQWQDRDRDGS